LVKKITGRPSNSRTPTRICIATCEILEGAGTTESAAAVVALAQHYAALGETVTLLWSPGKNEISEEKANSTKEYYKNNYLIDLDLLLKSEDMLPLLWTHEAQSLALYHYLGKNSFDVVIVALEGGLAYYPLLAKETAVGLKGTRIVVYGNAPIKWQCDADKTFLRSYLQLTRNHMEMYSLETADEFVCSSSSLLNWIKNQGWKITKKTTMLPALTPNVWQIPSRMREIERRGESTEIVILAGPEFRDGLTLACDTLDIVARHPSASSLTVTYFGPFGKILGEHTGGMILRRSRKWPMRLQLFRDGGYTDRLLYLMRRGSLAFIPCTGTATGHWLQACLENRIPFVATDAGANADIIGIHGEQEHQLIATKARDLAQKIIESTQTAKKLLPQIKQSERSERWTAALDRFAAAKPRHASAAKRKPLVSIIMAHHDRPDYVLQAIDAIEKQTYKNIEFILVDDGSARPDSKLLLKKLEEKFRRKKGWQLIRQKNKYLGAARNNGVRNSNGEYILFVDDDNALFHNAVETFVTAMETSDADICTALQMLFYEEYIPESKAGGNIQYIPLGGSVDLGFIHDTFGDANAMIRRSVFDEIGFQAEEYGYTAHDWHFFARATLAGLKLRLIPEPLYWYRGSAEGMYRTSHWYENRLPIIAAFEKYKFNGVKYLYDLILSREVTSIEQEGFKENLRYTPSGTEYLELCSFDPNEPNAIHSLARLAAMEGRADTSMILLGESDKRGFGESVLRALTAESAADTALQKFGVGMTSEEEFDLNTMRQFQSCRDGADSQTLLYAEKPGDLYLGARGKDIAVAILPKGCPVGTTSVSATAELGDLLAKPTEVLIRAIPHHADPFVVAANCKAGEHVGSSGWKRVSTHGSPQQISAEFSLPTTEPMNLLIAAKSRDPISGGQFLVKLNQLKIRRSAGWPSVRRARLGPPPYAQRARAISDGELRKAELVSRYKSERPLLMVDPNNSGIYLRPHKSGPVVAKLPWVFPPFASSVVAQVEIAHEDAGDFEFAMALTRSDESVDWNRDVPAQAKAFSGWVRVHEKFVLQDISVSLSEKMKAHLHLNLAIRLPKGASPAPAHSYWRNLIISWNE
jgi:glycosyltransferase involved in cell wall biosynthesis